MRAAASPPLSSFCTARNPVLTSHRASAARHHPANSTATATTGGVPWTSKSNLIPARIRPTGIRLRPTFCNAPQAGWPRCSFLAIPRPKPGANSLGSAPRAPQPTSSARSFSSMQRHTATTLGSPKRSMIAYGAGTMDVRISTPGRPRARHSVCCTFAIPAVNGPSALPRGSRTTSISVVSYRIAGGRATESPGHVSIRPPLHLHPKLPPRERLNRSGRRRSGGLSWPSSLVRACSPALREALAPAVS